MKENKRMPKRLSSLATLLGLAGLLSLAILPIASASAASPWWQVLSGSRPTNLWTATDNVQEISSEVDSESGALAVGMTVDGNSIGCLGGGSYFGFYSADELCQLLGYPEAIETAADLKAALEGPFGTSTVEVSGGPAGSAPLVVTVPGRPAPEIKLKNNAGEPFIGTATNTVLSQGGSGRLVLTLTNLGNAKLDATSSHVKIVDKLPEGAIATGVEAIAGFQDKSGPVQCAVEAPEEVICKFEGELPSFEAIEVEILTSLPGSPPVALGGAPGEVSVSGGNAPAASAPQTLNVSPDPVRFGIERFSAEAEEEGGSPVRQAGSHPFQFTTTLQLNAGAVSGDDLTKIVEQPALPRNLRFPLPAGLIGNATIAPQCTMTDFLTRPPNEIFLNSCPDESAIGVASVTIIAPGSLGLVRQAVPVFNLPPAHGEPARFGIFPVGDPVVIDTALEPDDKYRIVASVSNVTQLAQLLASTTTLWGTPGDPRHDNARGWSCTDRIFKTNPCARPSGLGEGAFLRMPVNCNSPLDFGMAVEPWNAPLGSVIDSTSASGEPMLGCNRVPFDPTVSSAPTAKLAESPSGLDFKLTMPNSGLLNKDAIAEGQPKKVEVTMPEGMTLNPSAAEGLATCSPADYARERFDSRPGEGCPEASKIGNVKIKTPLIGDQIDGALYEATPHENPFDSLLALYIVARAPERGVLVKLPLRVDTNKQSGQIVTTLDNSPQQPIESFEMHFREGGRAPLVTPPACGDYPIVAKFVPWSAADPDNPAPGEVVTRTSTFTVQHGVDGGPCPSGGLPPFDPGYEAGSINNDAGSFSPFDMRLTRKDGEQDMTKFSTVLPPGVLGSLAGVGKCPDAAVAAAKAKTGKEEQASPSCPASSEIGRSTVGAGVGSVLTWIPGKIYLGGPYHGDPLSVIAITPAVAGPFDVGTVVVQEALTLNPRTAEVEVDGAHSDPIPHILEGIPAKIRDLRVYVDRPEFILNPTSCDESSAKAILFGSYLDVLSPADDKPAALSTRYQAANCQNLGFKPHLALQLKGGTRRGGHPGLKATYTPRRGDANLKGLTVRLPSSAFLDQAHIRTICTRVQFAAGGGNGEQCPKGARYGYIKAWTPLLEEPLEGPVFLRSSNHKLPDLLFALHGLVNIEVDVRIDSAHGGIRASLEDAPDATLSRVVLHMQGAKKGLIINSKNLCAATNRANVLASGHNGKQFHTHPLMKAQCGKARHKKHKRHHR
ncbi:MAG TPA: hypothetical protein VFI09_09715 [Solirubrobacterales bacterium]|nr:hypothetical protein [Solirubrobacterales bacterium]